MKNNLIKKTYNYGFIPPNKGIGHYSAIFINGCPSRFEAMKSSLRDFGDGRKQNIKVFLDTISHCDMWLARPNNRIFT